jgi:hypothetical protein
MRNSTRIALAFVLAAAAASGCREQVVVAAGASDASPDAFVAGPPDLGSDALDVPLDVHVTWQRSPDTTLTFSWRTMVQTGYEPKVWLAPADQCAISAGDVILPSGAEHTLAGAGAPYTAEKGQRVEWSVEATGLEPDTEYLYRVGTWDALDPSGEPQNPRLGPLRRARTGLPPGSDAPFSFGVAGDTQGALVDLAEHIDGMAATPAAFWLLTGDMVSSSAQKYWDAWFTAAAPLLDRAVVMPVRGNHETSYGTFFGQFAVPTGADGPTKIAEHAWSFDFGNAHVVGLDSTVSVETEAIAAWLDADLAAADADPAIVWKIAFFHYPAYSASSHGCTARILEHWAPVLEAHGVDLVFSGHDHDYERTVPIANGMAALPGEGVTYVVTGALFASLYNAGEEWWTAYSEKTDNYVVVDVDGDALLMTALDPNDQSVIDEVLLTK